MTVHNAALYIPTAKAPFRLEPAELYEPGPNDLLVKNTSLALNPLEHRFQKLAIFPVQYPHISGFSFAGTVEKVGSAVTAFKPGDHVAAINKFSEANPGNRYGAFQKYALIQDTAAAKLDKKVDLDHASAIMASLLSTIGALNVCMGMERPPLSDKQAPKNNQKFLIYGGSSMFGLLTSEYAIRAGYDVVTTASPRTMDEVKRFCPSATILDHTLPHGELVEALVASGPYAYSLDTIAKPETTAVVADVLKRSGGGVFWSSQPVQGPDPNMPEGVERKGESYPVQVELNEELRKWTFEEYLPKGLIGGLITAPRIEKVAGGLSSVPSALERFGEGQVSGVKLVVDPSETETQEI